MTDLDYALSFCNAGPARRVPPPGRLLKQMIAVRKTSGPEIAQRIGEAPHYVSSLMAGQQNFPDDVCGRLAYALDLPVEFWFLAQQRYRYQCYLDDLRAQLARATQKRVA